MAFGKRASVLIPCPSSRPVWIADLRSLSRGRAKLWFRTSRVEKKKKDVFGHCQEPPCLNTSRVPPHLSPSVQKQSVAGFPLLPTTLAHSQPAPPSPQHPNTFAQSAPPCPLAALRQQSIGLRAAGPLTPGQVVCSDRRRLASASQGERCGRLTGSPPGGRANSSCLGQPGRGLEAAWLVGGRARGKGAGCGKKR